MKIVMYAKSQFAEKIDACSRVKLFGANAIDSREIVRFGNVTRIPGGGITDASGWRALLSAPSGGYLQTDMDMDGSYMLQPSLEICPIAGFLADQNNMSVLDNSLYLCRKLRLHEKEPDQADGHWVRCYCDPDQPATPGTIPLNFYFPDGIFDCRQEMFTIQGYAFPMEKKFFKTADSPSLLGLHFKPTHSRLWQFRLPIHPGEKVFITSELGTVLNNKSCNMCWFQNCGNPAEIDFSPLRSCQPVFWVMEFPDAPRRTQNSFAEALAFKAAALRQSVHVSIEILFCRIPRPHNKAKGEEYHYPLQDELTDDEFIRRCDDWRLDVDPILRGNPYEIKLGRTGAAAEELLPFFFNRGQLTLFQETAEPSARNILLQVLNGTKTFADHSSGTIKTLMFCRRGNNHRLKKQLRNISTAKLNVYEDAALLAPGLNAMDAMKKLLDETRPELILLELSGYSDAQEKSLLTAVDFCLEHGISVGVFCNEVDITPALIDMADRNLIIGRLNADTYIIKEKTENGSSTIRRFSFESEVVSIEDSDEIELNKVIHQ